MSARSAYGHEAYEAESASARLEGGDEGAESARHELEAAREALRASKGRHTRELDAVRRGWTSRCDELTTTVARLRAQLASAEAEAKDVEATVGKYRKSAANLIA